MQVDESLTWITVTSFSDSNSIDRQRFRIDGNAAATLSCNTLIVYCRDGVGHLSSTTSRHLLLAVFVPYEKSRKDEIDPLAFLVILERASLSLAQAACHGREILSAGQAILSSLLGGGVRRRIA